MIFLLEVFENFIILLKHAICVVTATEGFANKSLCVTSDTWTLWQNLLVIIHPPRPPIMQEIVLVSLNASNIPSEHDLQ